MEVPPDRRAWRLAVWAGFVVLAACPMLRAGELAAFNRGPWPFRPPERPEVPAVSNAAWVRNPIDAFIMHALAAKGLEPSGEAERLALLRRVTFDLTGLLPSVAEQQAFRADTAEGAYERVVEQLLESPRYGERWAQHWLDLVRYAETDGFKSDEHRVNAYKYRDYVIRALAADLPYDRFICQQLAGDELEPDNPEALLATGLNRLYPDESNAANVRQRRQEIHDELTDTTALVFLGLTVGCAQCHDHKFDPITQVDYYRLQAFFATLLPRDDVPVATAEAKRRWAIDERAWDEATRKIRSERTALLAPQRDAAFEDALEKFSPDIREALRRSPQERSCLERQLAYQAMQYVKPKMAVVSGEKLKGDEKGRYEALGEELKLFAHLKPDPLPTAMAVSDAAGEAPPTHRLALGDFRKPLEEVRPGFPAFLGASEPAIEPPPAAGSSGRRAALARWLCRADHPLTARVMVNRLWQHHFGEGIVASPNDFGAMGEPPTHPELLDWLAVEFVARGWSLKAMHRLMVTSAAYRQSSLVDWDDPRHAKAREIDGANRLLWHARRRRLEGEALRDCVLQLSGDLHAGMFGPSVRPELPAGVASRAAWEPEENPHQRNRRSIYVLAKRNLRYPLFDVFDLPDMHNSCPRRSATTTAPQALALLNGEFTLQQAQRWCGRLLEETDGDTSALVRAAWRQAYGREAQQDELRAALEFVAQQTEAIGAAGENAGAALVDFCHAVVNSNEFLYVD